MPCHDPRDGLERAARYEHHHRVEKLVEQLLKDRDLAWFEATFRAEQSRYKADIHHINTRGIRLADAAEDN